MTDRRNAWTEAMDAALARMWAEGHTGAVIAAHFRKTRNAVIGRVHRLHLPARPSPIAGYVPRPPAPRPRKAEKPVIVAPPVVVPPPPPPERAPSWGCAWLEGERPTWRRCDAPVWRNTSWCREHYAVCYQRMPVAAHALGHWTRG
jgi:GcrA cell cycle regulator